MLWEWCILMFGLYAFPRVLSIQKLKWISCDSILLSAFFALQEIEIPNYLIMCYAYITLNVAVSIEIS